MREMDRLAARSTIATFRPLFKILLQIHVPLGQNMLQVSISISWYVLAVCRKQQ